MKIKNIALICAFCTSITFPIRLCSQQADLYVPDRLLVKSIPGATVESFHQQNQVSVYRTFSNLKGVQSIRIPNNISLDQAVDVYRQSGLFEYVEKIGYAELTSTTPNDPSFSTKQWNLHNTGQTGGSNDADIDAPEAWDTANAASSVTVAVIDTGIRYTHEDLSANMWTNSGEIAGNGVDDDGNGFIDDVYGVDVYNSDSNPNDDNGHGTHVAGIIGAVGNNSKGVSGVAWNVKMMAVKVFPASGSGSPWDIIAAGFDYAISKKANIINASLSGNTYSTLMRDIIGVARDHGILVVVAAGNKTEDIDTTPAFPARYHSDNIINVAATTKSDTLAAYSNYAANTVHLAAPGGEYSIPLEPSTNKVYSTYYASDSSYEWLSGTSMAAPHVSGALALAMAVSPMDSYLQIKNRLLSSVDVLGSLSGKCVTQGRLNLNKLLTSTHSRPFNDTFANAYEVVKLASGDVVTYGNNIGATKETGEPNHASNTGGKSVWWKWTAKANGNVTIRTLGSGFDTLLAVYTGSAVNSLTQVQSDDNGCQCKSSRLTFNAVSNTVYKIAVDGYSGVEGSIKLELLDNPASEPPNIAFTLSTLQRPANQFKATLTGKPFSQVQIEYSSDLFSWTYFSSPTFGAGGSYNFTDSTATVPIRFYRAKTYITEEARSCNVVGYVDKTFPAGQSMHSNPFKANANTVSSLIGSPASGSILYKWNEGTQAWIVDDYYSSWADPNLQLLPGEGFIFDNSSTQFVRSFVGEVVLGYSSVSVPNTLSIKSLTVPVGGLLRTDYRIPVISGDVISRMTGNGTYTGYTYSSGSWSPSQPSVAVGEAFWCNKQVGFTWSRNFLVWP